MVGLGVFLYWLMVIKVSVFVVVMLLVVVGLVVVFGDFWFGFIIVYYVIFIDVLWLKVGQKVCIVGVLVGLVKVVKFNLDYSIDVVFVIDCSYMLYLFMCVVIWYENLVGDWFLEIMLGLGELCKLLLGGIINVVYIQFVLDFDVLLGGLWLVLKGFDVDKINIIISVVIELLQGQGGLLVNVFVDIGVFLVVLGVCDQLIGEVIINFNVVLVIVDVKSV